MIVAYLDSSFQPAAKRLAAYVKVILSDGRMVLGAAAYTCVYCGARRYHLPGQHDQCDHSVTGDCSPEGVSEATGKRKQDFLNQLVKENFQADSKQLNVKILYRGIGYKVALAGAEFSPGGQYNPKNNILSIYDNSIEAGSEWTRGLLAHELSHARFNQVKSEQINEYFGEKFSELDKTGDFTNYSASWWKAYRTGGGLGTAVITARDVINESLAEAERMIHNGESNKVPAIWKQLRDRVRNA